MPRPEGRSNDQTECEGRGAMWLETETMVIVHPSFANVFEAGAIPAREVYTCEPSVPGRNDSPS